MKIRKVLNNNVVIASDKDNSEVVAMGCGLGFGKKIGDCFAKTEAQKIFILSDKELIAKYYLTMKDIEPDVIDIAENIISFAIEKQNLRAEEVIHISLTDHISGLVERLKRGIFLTNELQNEIKFLYPDEYKVGKYAIKYIEEKTGLKPQHDEAAFIAMHFINTCMNDRTTISQVNSFVKDIITITEKMYEVETNEEKHNRFVSQLKLLAQDYFNEDEPDNDVALHETLSEKYPETAKNAAKISSAIRLKYKKELALSEQAFLIIFIEKYTK